MTVNTKVEFVHGDVPKGAVQIEVPSGWSLERIQRWLNDDAQIEKRDQLQVIASQLEKEKSVYVVPAHRERAAYRREASLRWQRGEETKVWGVLTKAA